MFELFIFLLLGFALGFAIAWLVAEKRANTAWQQRFNKKNAELASEKEKRIYAEARATATENAEKNNEERIAKSFETVADKAVRNNHELLIKMAGGTLEKYFTEAGTVFSEKTEHFLGVLNPLNEKLDKHEKLVTDLKTSTGETFGSLGEKITSLKETQSRLEHETSALVGALKSPRIRGRWGEIGLRRVLEFSGMNEYADFTEQAHTPTESGNLRPDILIKLPGNRTIAVDSKLPLNSYLNAMEADNEATRNEKLKKHAQAVAEHVRQLGSKEYWNELENSVDFVVLYIEVEPAFGAALSINKDLAEKAIGKQVVFATPTTLIALLKTISYAWKQHNTTENAVEIWKAAKEMYDRLRIFSEHFGKIGANMNSLLKTYNQAVGSWENRVMPGIKKLTEMDVDSANRKPETQKTIDATARELSQKNEHTNT